MQRVTDAREKWIWTPARGGKPDEEHGADGKKERLEDVGAVRVADEGDAALALDLQDEAQHLRREMVEVGDDGNGGLPLENRDAFDSHDWGKQFYFLSVLGPCVGFRKTDDIRHGF